MNDDKVICPKCGSFLVRKNSDWWVCPDCCALYYEDADGVLV